MGKCLHDCGLTRAVKEYRHDSPFTSFILSVHSLLYLQVNNSNIEKTGCKSMYSKSKPSDRCNYVNVRKELNCCDDDLTM